jgi:four helix bundle protein
MLDFHAKASCAELRSHLYVACDIGYLQEAGFAALLDQAEEVGRIVGGLRASIARQRTSKVQLRTQD